MWSSRIAVSFAAVVLFLCNALVAQAQGNSGERGPDGGLPAVVGKGSLTVSGNGYWHRQTLEDGDYPSISPLDTSGQVLPDGVYRYEFRTFPGKKSSSPRQQELMRAKGAGLGSAAFSDNDVETISGQFEVRGGQLVFN